jgi:hypothetical protein
MKHLRMHALPSLIVLASLIAISACDFSTANIKRAVMAREVNEDKSPAIETGSFHRSESLLHCCVQMANTPSGTMVKAIWRFNDDEENAAIDSTEIQMDDSGWIDFTLEPANAGLPYDSYAVDLYVDGVFKQTVPFTVEPMFEESVVREAVLSTALNDSYYPLNVAYNFPTETDVIYAPIFVEGQAPGSIFSAFWYQHDADGARILITSADIQFDDDGWIGFSMTLNDGLPAGQYSVDIVHNGTVEHTIEFSGQ